MTAQPKLESPPKAAGTSSPQIEVRNVFKSFGRTQALKDVSMTVTKGEARALLGRNGAGKSTLVGLLTGMIRPDSGDVQIAEPDDASARSISCVYQHSRLVPGLTVAENIVLANYPRAVGGIRWGETARIAREALAPWNLEHLADELVQDLAPVQMKVVEICRALAERPSVLLLDEPTAGLDRRDAEQLFSYIDKLKAKNVTLIYVSHHLDEVYRFCDSITVLRDARVAVTAAVSELPKSALIEAMMGQAQQSEVPAVARKADLSAGLGLSIRGLTIPGAVHGFDLDLRRGECVGIAGLEGSGKAEIGAAIAGLVMPADGTITVEGRPHKLGDVASALVAGIGYVPENRHRQGMVLGMSLAENSTLTALPGLAKTVVPLLPRILLPSVLKQVYGKLAVQWNIVASGPDQLISELSGGNQQKCVMARALATAPRVLVLQNPTAGVDIAAKASIMGTLSDILETGASILVISEDSDDFVLASRIVVVNHGRIGTELQSGWTDHDLVAAMQGAMQ